MMNLVRTEGASRTPFLRGCTNSLFLQVEREHGLKPRTRLSLYDNDRVAQAAPLSSTSVKIIEEIEQLLFWSQSQT
jgi:hypothetical protein